MKQNYKIDFETKEVNMQSSTRRSRQYGSILLQTRCCFNCSIHSSHRKTNCWNFHQIHLTAKDQCFSLTIELSDWNSLLALIDSMGYQSAIKQILWHWDSMSTMWQTSTFNDMISRGNMTWSTGIEKTSTTREFLQNWRWSEMVWDSLKRMPRNKSIMVPIKPWRAYLRKWQMNHNARNIWLDLCFAILPSL